ncbi:MAG: tetratricopeptide repeat protein [Candidatus Methylomirabilales bacterium]
MAFDKRKALQAALAFTQQGRLDKAIAEYQSVLKADPNDLSVLNTLGDLYARTGNRTEAINQYMRLGDAYRKDGVAAKATAVYKKVIKLDPHNLQAQTLCADLYAEQGLVGEAKQQLLLIAEQCSRSGDTKEALAVYQKVVTLDPGNVAAATKLSDMLARQGMGQDAYGQLARSAEQCLAAGQTAEAQKIFRRMLQMNPKAFDAHLGLGRLLAKTGSAEALQELRAAASVAPDDAAQWAALGDGFREARDAKRAQEAYAKALRLDPERWEVHLGLGAMAADGGDVARATEEIRQAARPALKAGKGQEVVRLLDGLAAKTPGEVRYRVALVEVLKGLGNKAALADAYRGLGQALEKQGKRAEALEAYRSLHAMDPQARDAAEKVATLSTAAPPAAPAAPPSVTVRLTPAPTPVEMEMEPGLVDLSEGKETPAEEAGTITLDEQATEDARTFAARLEKELGGGPEEIAFDLTEAAQEGALDPGAIAQGAEQVLLEMAGPGEESPAAGVLELGEEPAAGAASGATLATEDLLVDLGGARAPVEAPPAEEEDYQVSDHLAKADVYLKYGLVDKAIEHLQQALSLSPRHLVARQRLKGIYLDRNLAEQAVTEGLSIASILVGRGHTAQAAAELESCIKLDPGNAEVREALERLSGGVARTGAPRTVLKPPAAPRAPVEVARPAEEVAEAEPLEEALELPESLAGRGLAEELAEADFFIEQEMVEEARGVLKQILSADPRAAEAKRRLEALEAGRAAAPAPQASFADVGVDSADEGREAVELLEEPAPEPARPTPPAPVRPGRPSSFQPSAEDVKPVFKVARDEGPGEGGYVDLGAELTEEVGVGPSPRDASPLLAEILREFQKGVREQLGPEDYETHYNLGIAYKEMELYDEAIEEFRLAAKEPRRALTCANLLGLCFLAKGDAGRAVTELERALSLPGAPGEEGWGVRYDLATAYEAAGNLAKAHAVLSALQEEAPKFRDVKARLRDLKGRLKEAPAPSPPAPASSPPEEPQRPGKSKKKISFI